MIRQIHPLKNKGEFRKTGIGQELLDTCIRKAEEEKYMCIDTSVFADNGKMLRLLIKNEFRPFEIQHRKRADGMDIIRLRKYLKETIL